MNRNDDLRVVEFAKAREYRRYEKVYVLFLWVSSIGIIAIGLVVTVGVIYMLSKQYYILIAGECKAFIYGSAFLLCAGILALMSGILTCAVTTTKGKFVLTIFFGHIFAVGLVTSGLILTGKMSSMIEWSPTNEKNVILDIFRDTLNDSLYRDNWIRIHKDFRCCGIESLEGNLHLVENINYTTTNNSSSGVIISMPQLENDSIISARDNDSDRFEKLTAVAQILGVKVSYCVNILRDAHRGCGILLLSQLEKKTNLLKFYGTLILPMIFIADVLFFLGYLCLKEIKISLMMDTRV